MSIGWVEFLLGLHGSNYVLRGSTFYWVIIFTWFAWVSFYCLGQNIFICQIFCMGQNFLCEENMRGPSFISNLGDIFMV